MHVVSNLAVLFLQERAWHSASQAVDTGERHVRAVISQTLSAVQNLESGATAAAAAALASLAAGWAADPGTREAVVAIGATCAVEAYAHY